MHWQLYVQIVPGYTGPPLLPNRWHHQEMSEALPLASTTSWTKCVNKGYQYTFTNTEWINISRIFVAFIKHQGCNHQIHLTWWHNCSWWLKCINLVTDCPTCSGSAPQNEKVDCSWSPFFFFGGTARRPSCKFFGSKVKPSSWLEFRCWKLSIQ